MKDKLPKLDNTFTVFLGGVDLQGNPVERTQCSHPYNYDDFVEYDNRKKVTANGGAYSDRMYGWDSDKFNKCSELVWGNFGQHFNQRKPKEIERFLQLYNEDDKLKLSYIIHGCNQASGFPVWYFAWDSG